MEELLVTEIVNFWGEGGSCEGPPQGEGVETTAAEEGVATAGERKTAAL